MTTLFRDFLNVRIASAIATTALLLHATAFAQVDRGETPPLEEHLQLSADIMQTVGGPEGAPIAGAALKSKTEALSSRIRCPVCQGHAVADSPAEAARNMKQQVRAMVAAGYSEAQILRYFETRYGEFIRLMPRARGFNLLVWLIPLGSALIGFFLLIRTFRRRETPGTGQANDTQADKT